MELKFRQKVYFKVNNQYFEGKYHRPSYKKDMIEVKVGDEVKGVIVDVPTTSLITEEEYSKGRS